MNEASVREGGNVADTFARIREDALRQEGVPLSEIKREINALLWAHLPAETTMGEAEAIACRCFDAILEAHDATPTRIGDQCPTCKGTGAVRQREVPA